MMTPLRFLLLIGFLAGLPGTFFGCRTAPPPHLSDDFGQAYRSGFNAQCVNPEAPEDSSPPDKTPGDVAIQVYEQKYVKGLMEKEKKAEDISSALSGMD